MSTALLHGLVRPVTNDSGESFFPQLEANVQYQSDVLSNTSSVLSAAWGASLGFGGQYRQLITLPVLLTASPKSFIFDDLQLKVKDASGNVCYPSIVRVSDTTFYIYTNDNTVAYTINYGV